MSNQLVAIAIDIMTHDQLVQNLTTDMVMLRRVYQLDQANGLKLFDLMQVMANYPVACVRNGLKILLKFTSEDFERSWEPEQVMKKKLTASRIIAMFIADATEVL